MLQNLAVAVIVLLAALYACAKYLPSGWRRRIVYLLARRGAGQGRMAKWFNTESSCGSGCDTCKACAEPEPERDPGPAARRVIKIRRP